MKKYFGMIMILMIMGTSIGANIQTENYINPDTTSQKVINEDLAPDVGGSINNIRLRFCNQIDQNVVTTQLALHMRPGQRSRICIAIANNNNEAKIVSLGFVEAKIDEQGIVSCQNDTQTNSFTNNIHYKPTTGIVVPASGTVIQQVSYVAPKNTSGEVIGCVVYKTLDTATNTDTSTSMFTVVVRKIAPIYINITGSVYQWGQWDAITDFSTHYQQILLKIMIALLAVRLMVTIIQTIKKPTNLQHTKPKTQK